MSGGVCGNEGETLAAGALGRHLGLTFSQVQKYEKGTNRIGAGRLPPLLGVPLEHFYEGPRREARRKPEPGGPRPTSASSKRSRPPICRSAIRRRAARCSRCSVRWRRETPGRARPAARGRRRRRPRPPDPADGQPARSRPPAAGLQGAPAIGRCSASPGGAGCPGMLGLEAQAGGAVALAVVAGGLDRHLGGVEQLQPRLGRPELEGRPGPRAFGAGRGFAGVRPGRSTRFWSSGASPISRDSRKSRCVPSTGRISRAGSAPRRSV